MSIVIWSVDVFCSMETRPLKTEKFAKNFDGGVTPLGQQ